MADLNIKTKFETKFSLASIEEYQDFLRQYQKKLPKVAENIVEKVSEIGLKDNYKSTKKLPVQNNGNIITGGIETTDEKDTYREFGTGIIGSQNPAVSDFLAKTGWEYDVNEHGEKGWIYPKRDGTFGWTKGIPAEKKFYNAMRDMEESFKEIAIEEFRKISGK